MAEDKMVEAARFNLKALIAEHVWRMANADELRTYNAGWLSKACSDLRELDSMITRHKMLQEIAEKNTVTVPVDLERAIIEQQRQILEAAVPRA
jgi:hypothetical protein